MHVLKKTILHCT